MNLFSQISTQAVGWLIHGALNTPSCTLICALSISQFVSLLCMAFHATATIRRRTHVDAHARTYTLPYAGLGCKEWSVFHARRGHSPCNFAACNLSFVSYTHVSMCVIEACDAVNFLISFVCKIYLNVQKHYDPPAQWRTEAYLNAKTSFCVTDITYECRYRCYEIGQESHTHVKDLTGIS